MKLKTRKKPASGPTLILASLYSPNTITKLRDHVMNNHKHKTQVCKPKSDNLKKLLSVCKTERESGVLKVLWENQGLFTHEIGDKYGWPSNNQHNFTRDINPRLIKIGWVITKYHVGKHHKSSCWFIEPVVQALANPIRKDLRATIAKHMEAANDE